MFNLNFNIFPKQSRIIMASGDSRSTILRINAYSPWQTLIGQPYELEACEYRFLEISLTSFESNGICLVEVVFD